MKIRSPSRNWATMTLESYTVHIYIRLQKISTSQNQESGVIRTGLVAGRRNYFSIEITMFSISESTFGCSWYTGNGILYSIEHVCV